jgi:DNA polymerase-1
MDVQQVDLDEFGTMGTALHSFSMIHPLAAATKRGIKIDTAERERIAQRLHTEIDRLQAFLDSAAGGPVNVKSPKQISDLLYNKLGLPPQRKRGSDGLSTDKDAIVKLAGKSNHPALHSILAIRERRDLLERYVQAPIDADGRMRCSFDIAGTRSGRLASRKSIYGSGTNLQTIPEELRRFFIADEGYTFVYRDYSQAEARVVAYLARCQGLIDLFNDPTRDVHKENAARIFNKSIPDVAKTERYLAKRVVHASNYGMEADRLVEIVNQDAEITGVRIDRTQAQFLLDRYFAIYPEIREIFWGDVRRAIQQSRTLTNAFGRKRTFYGRWDEALLRDAYSWDPQSTVGDLCTRAMVLIHNHVPQAQLLLNVHDSILVQCLHDDVPRVAREMERLMQICITIHGREFYIPTDCKIGANWGNASDNNPNGLVDYEPV